MNIIHLGFFELDCILVDGIAPLLTSLVLLEENLPIIRL